MKLTQKGYEVGGINLLSIVKDHGSPVYVYDADQIVANYHTLKNAFKGVPYIPKSLQKLCFRDYWCVNPVRSLLLIDIPRIVIIARMRGHIIDTKINFPR
jgi:hypothetical protein